MKKLMLVIGCLVVFSGCATDGLYNTGKAVYKGGKVVAKELPLRDKTKAKLKKIDKAATTYDKARSTVREGLDTKK
jgi:hypothetical protein